jgi:hypothetical protein
MIVMRKPIQLAVLGMALLFCVGFCSSCHEPRRQLMIVCGRSTLMIAVSRGECCLWWSREQRPADRIRVKYFPALPADLFLEYVENRDFALRVSGRPFGWVLATEDPENPLNDGKRDFLLLIPRSHWAGIYSALLLTVAM